MQIAGTKNKVTLVREKHVYKQEHSQIKSTNLLIKMT
jgi:hypothetical protein